MRLLAPRCHIFCWMRAPDGLGHSGTILTYPHLWNGMKRSIVKECKDHQRDNQKLETLIQRVNRLNQLISSHIFTSKTPSSHVSWFQHVSTCFNMWCLQDPRMREHSWCHQQRLEESNGCSRQHEARPKSTCPAFQESGTQKRWCVWGQIRSTDLNLPAKLSSYLTWRLFPYVSIIPQHRYDRFHPALQFLAASKYFSLFQYSRGAFTPGFVNAVLWICLSQFWNPKFCQNLCQVTICAYIYL
jgi:hypothetical protein